MEVVTEKLIMAVRCQPILFSKNMSDHSKKHLVLKAWEMVSGEVGVSVQECQKMWRSLRDGYMREKRSQMLTKSGSAAVKEKKPWKWYNHMIFLSDHISFRPTQSNFELPIRVEVGSGGEIQETEEPEENVIYEDSGQVQLDYVAETNPILFESPNGRTSSCSFAQPRSPTPKRKKASKGECSKSEFERDLIGIVGKEQDPDEMFCLVLAADIKKLSDKKKAFIKFKIQELLFKLSIDQISLD
ncbi:uncharacterized protein LOC136034033 [Artemia franciscana]|uniref:uncharacterized protein LOC136034033 n=1 Tax=Artemia franciscana TaxID=6661 RepID=UPI0032DAE1A4